jgi:hypothetical protein
MVHRLLTPCQDILGHLDRADVRGTARSDVAERFRSNLDRFAAPAFSRNQAGPTHGDCHVDGESQRRTRCLAAAERSQHGSSFTGLARQQVGAGGLDGYGRRLAVVPISSLRRQLRREIGWTSGRGLYCGRMISGWALDVFQFDCRGKIPYCCVRAGHRCVFLARNYDRATRLRSDAREHRQQNRNSACVHIASLPGQSEINLHISGGLLFFIQ